MELHRVLGSALIALCGVIGAYSLDRATLRSLKRTESFVLLVRYIRSQIECFSMSIPRALERCPREIYEGCGYESPTPPLGLGELLEGVEAFVGIGGSPNKRDTAIHRIMSRFAAEAGRGYREEQLKLCDRCIEELQGELGRQTSELPVRRKLGGALCICGAIAVVILLI